VGLFNRRADAKDEPVHRALTGAGARLNLDDPKALMVRRRDWQEAAWGYRDSVPELRFACRFVSMSLSRLRIFPAENQPRGQEPLPLGQDSKSTISARTQAAALAAIERLDLDSRGVNMMARLGENMEVAAEAYLLGQRDPESPSGEKWTVRSVTEVRVDGSGKISLVEPGSGRSTPQELVPGEVELLRIWNPHPQYYEWPDSELSANLDTCEELRLYDRLLRASARSRIGSGTALYIPEEFSLTRAGSAPVRADVDGTDEDDDPFMDDLVAAMIEPISSEDSPEAVVPMVIRGPAFVGDQPAKDLIGVVQLGRQDPERVIEYRDAATTKLGRNINLPPEVMSGMGDTNHWSAWSIDANTCKNHIEPRAELICDSLTVAYLRPALLAVGCPPEEVAKVCLWFDPSELVQNPNRGQDARDAHGAGVLSDLALARTLGFPDEDMPDIYERVFRAIEARALSDQQIPLLLALGKVPENDPIMVAAVAAAKASVAQQAPRTGGNPVIEQPPTPDSPTPVAPTPTRPAQIASAATPDLYRVRTRLCQELARLDSTMTVALLAHADATVGRAVELTANRIRARAVKDKELAAAFRGRPAAEVVAELGSRVWSYQDQADMDDAVGHFRGLWETVTAAAAERVADVSAELLGVPHDYRLVETLTAAARGAWAWLEQQIRRVAQSVLYGGKPGDLPGEKPGGVVPPAVIRGALAQAGGLPLGSPGVEDTGRSRTPLRGMATGQTATAWRTERGAVDLGYEWQYYGLERHSFLPHRALSGRRFVGWTDDALAVRAGDEWLGVTHYFPGDHDGCLCGFLPIIASPMDPNEGRALADAAQLTETEGAREARVLLAEADDAAGRTNTVAQQARDARAALRRLREIHIEERETP
jgi:hypothetical protein